MKNDYLLISILSIIIIVLGVALLVILNTKIYFDTCWEDGTCQVDTRKVIELIKEDY